jgi:hypothetical protein
VNIARYKKGFVKASEYNSKLHFDNVYCPDCNIAKVKLVRKAEQDPYFEFVAGSEHDELCPKATKPIAYNTIKELLQSELKNDMSKINFLVNKNLERAINLLTKIDNGGVLELEDELDLMPQKKEKLVKNRIREYAKQNMYNLNAVELTKANVDSLNAKHVVIYGVAGISKTIAGNSIKLLFKVNQDVKFSVFLTPSQVQYFEFDNSKIAKFAIFGRVKKAGKFLNMEIRSTRDLVIKD